MAHSPTGPLPAVPSRMGRQQAPPPPSSLIVSLLSVFVPWRYADSIGQRLAIWQVAEEEEEERRGRGEG